jgi:ParB family transcriptional regulator, chromosome partitioning protein
MEQGLIEIPLSKLIPSPLNVRRTGRERGIEELAASIQSHGLLQNLSVKPARSADGGETGKYRVLGGGRRLAALKLLAKRKAIPRAYPVPCIVTDGNDEEVSLAENIMRADLHPADQFEAFRRLAEEQGFGAEEIAARFGVSANLVKQRMRLGAISPKLLAIYREDGLTLDQLMAFAVTADHARQEAVYESLSWNKEPYTIRRLLTESHIVAHDRRAVFVGLDAYEAAGGILSRDLFADDGGGYLEDAALLNRIALEKLETIANAVRNEGWRWVEASIDFPHAHGLRRIHPEPVSLSEEDEAALRSLKAQGDELTERYEAQDELPEEIALVFDELEAKIEALEAKRLAFDADTISRGGAFVAVAYDGAARIERGFIRPEDEPPSPSAPVVTAEEGGASGESASDEGEEPFEADGSDDAGAKPLPDALIRDLMAHRTLALRAELGLDPEVALLAVTHALAARLFYGGYDSGSCLTFDTTSLRLGSHAAGIEDTGAAAALAARHQEWAAKLPKSVEGLWQTLEGFEPGTRVALLAHCASLTVFAVYLPSDRKPLSLGASDHLAAALGLDMTGYWRPTQANYFGRVTKAQIVEAVREGVSEAAAQQLLNAKKADMAEAAEELLKDSGWLPFVLRTKEKAPAFADEAQSGA